MNTAVIDLDLPPPAAEWRRSGPFLAIAAFLHAAILFYPLKIAIGKLDIPPPATVIVKLVDAVTPPKPVPVQPTAAQKYIPLVRDLDKTTSSVFWIRSIILITLVFFGYQTVNISRFASKAARERLQDSMFGSVLGGFNGYLVAGSVLFYNHMANYPYPNIVSRAVDPAIAQAIETMMKYMPPRFLGEPSIYLAVIIVLIFIIVVYI